MNLSALLVCAVVAQPGDLPPFVREHARAVTFYYKSPDPDLAVKLLKEFIRKENVEHPWLNDRQHAVDLNAAAFGDMAAGKPKVVREYEAAFAAATPKGRRVVLRALMNCGDKETLKAIDGWLADKEYADLRPELESLKKHLEDPKRKHARDLPALQPKDLDYLWINFFVTGEYAPVSRLLDVFDQPDRPENATLKRVARWSLGSNLQQHPKLVELVEKHAKGRPEGSRKVIDELIIKGP